jgi:hypothetical protein
MSTSNRLNYNNNNDLQQKSVQYNEERKEEHTKDIQSITKGMSIMQLQDENKENEKSFENQERLTLSPNKLIMSKRVNLKLNKFEVTSFPKDIKTKIKYTF